MIPRTSSAIVCETRAVLKEWQMKDCHSTAAATAAGLDERLRRPERLRLDVSVDPIPSRGKG